MKYSKLQLKKSLGQHFLIDREIIKKIIKSCSNLNNTNVIEIGPGNGSLSKELVIKCKSLIAIEKDKDLVPYLEELKKNNKNFNYLIKDALTTNINTLKEKPKAIVANLPYNIGTLLFTNWLPIAFNFNYFILMFQKEVAHRITANVNDKHYGRLALFTKLFGKAEYLFTVSKDSFKPSPLVESAVIKFIPYPIHLKINIEKFTEITKIAFGMRRKTIKVSLKKYNFDFEKLNINPTSRPENLTFEQFIKLSSYTQ